MTNTGYGSSAFDREVLGKAAGQFAWAREMLHHDPVLAGVYIYALDVFVYAYTNDRDDLSYSTGRIEDLEQAYRNITKKEPVIETVTYEGAGCAKCVQHKRSPARRGFGRRLLECRGYRDSSAI